MIDTIKNDFGIPINHYIEMNFFAFRSVVAAIDGVPIYFTTPVRDTKTGLDVPEAGCITLDPVQALAFARSRAYEYFQDGRWRTDPTGDLGRISRQQEFIRKVIRRAIDKGARNPAVLNDLINAGTGALHLDPTITPADLVDIGKRFKDFNPDNLETYSVPVVGANKGGASVVLMKASEAEPILDIFRGVDANAPDSILVVVQNGTLTTGMGRPRPISFGKSASAFPTGMSATPTASTSPRRRSGTFEAARRAQRVASYLVAPPVFEEVTFIVECGCQRRRRGGLAGRTLVARPHPTVGHDHHHSAGPSYDHHQHDHDGARGSDNLVDNQHHGGCRSPHTTGRSLLMASRITVVGCGYVGLTTGVCFAHLGHEVTCTDVDVHRVDQLNRGEIPILEAGLDNLMREG